MRRSSCRTAVASVRAGSSCRVAAPAAASAAARMKATGGRPARAAAVSTRRASGRRQADAELPRTPGVGLDARARHWCSSLSEIG